MYSNRENLEAIFRMMDLDSNGLISIDEFKHACEMLSGEFIGYFYEQSVNSFIDLNRLKSVQSLETVSNQLFKIQHG